MTTLFKRMALAFVLSLTLAACSSNSNDVPSLAATPTPKAADEIRDNEALMMEFTECLRNEGLDVVDPVVDSDGNVGKPGIVDFENIPKEEWLTAWDACGEILESVTFEREEVDRIAQLEQYIELAACMGDAGYDIEEPTTETLDTWMGDFKNMVNWDDPDTMAAFETCMGGSSGGKNGKRK